MKFECGDLERALAVPELMAEAREHLKTCASCRNEYRLWSDISSAARELHEEWDSPALWPNIRQALEAGARGYILKNAMDLDLINAVKGVAEGKTVLDPQLVKPEALKGERDSGLTVRELEILQHIVAGKSNKEIATELKLSANTVAVHRANIMDALGIHKTAELVVYAIRNGLVSLP